MAIVGKCPACGETVEVPDDAPGGKVRCGTCGVPFTPDRGDRFTRERPPGRPARSRREAVTREPDEDAGTGWRPDDEEEDELPQPRWRRPRRSVVLEKVQGPAVLLMVYGALCLVVAAGLLVLAPVLALQKKPDPGAVAIFAVGGPLLLAAGGLTLAGGIRMRVLRNYGLVLASVIVTFVVGILTCIPMVAVGIWPLVVLLDPEVKASFDREAE
jgi:hypothetical protein